MWNSRSNKREDRSSTGRSRPASKAIQIPRIFAQLLRNMMESNKTIEFYSECSSD